MPSFPAEVVRRHNRLRRARFALLVLGWAGFTGTMVGRALDNNWVFVPAGIVTLVGFIGGFVCVMRMRRLVKQATQMQAAAQVAPPQTAAHGAATEPVEEWPSVEVLVGVERGPAGLPGVPVSGGQAAPDGKARPGWVAVRCDGGEAAVYGLPVRSFPFGDDPPRMEPVPLEQIRAAFRQARQTGAREPKLYLAFRGID